MSTESRSAANPNLLPPVSTTGGRTPPPLPKTKGVVPPTAPVPSAASPASEPANESEDEASEEQAEKPLPPYRRSFLNSRVFRNTSSCTVSMIVHAALFVAFGMWAVEPEVTRVVVQVLASIPEREEEIDPDQLSIELETSTASATEVTMAAASGSPEVTAVGGGTSGSIAAPTLDRAVVAQAAASEGSEISIETPSMALLPSTRLVKATPDGLLGDPRAVVDNYDQAMDRITQELMWMLSKGDVLCVWAFDESESMKDDQGEIRDRVDRVYTELGLTDRSNGDAITTSIVSFGAGFHVHTKKPTHNRTEIRSAIDSVPNDPSGKEMMCETVGTAIHMHREYAKRGKRQMALILVTDESGDRENNVQFLEQAIAIANEAHCRVYVLGREANFGYPYAHIRWVHPDTHRVHWLQIDRGPETAFYEQLQTNGFHRRYDAFSSGFGPYEQTRLTRETNGIFFMLPSVETDLVGSEKRRYTLDAMRSYNPDLRSRPEVYADRDKFPLRTLLWKVANDLDPYNPGVSKIIEMRMEFSIDLPVLFQQARQEQQKALIYLTYLDRAQKELEKNSRLRAQETSPRWQANYDLMLAQLIAYQARIYEYGAYLETYLKNPKTAPALKPPNLHLTDWHLHTRPKLVAPEKSQPYIDKAASQLKAIMADHPGTPWAARAQWELNRGFGLEFFPDYHPPYPTVSNPRPVPKL